MARPDIRAWEFISAGALPGTLPVTVNATAHYFPSMKNIPKTPQKTGLGAQEIIRKISAAKKVAEARKKKARETKILFKKSRKAYRLAKKAAKESRRAVKELERSLVAARAAAARLRKAKKPRPATVRKSSSAKAAATPKEAPVAPTGSEIASTEIPPAAQG